MKKYITMIIAAASISTAVSCNRTFDEKDVPSDGTIYVTRTYEAGLDEATKTAIDATGKVTWEQGDVIRYYSQKNGQVKTCTIDEACEKAELALDVTSTANFLIAVYGGSGLSENLGSSVTIQGAIPAEQTGVFGDHHVAITKTYDVTQQSLTFHNLVSYLKFTLTRTDVAKVVFKANDGTQLHGNGSVTVSLPDETPSAAFGSEGGSSITVLNGGAGTFYIATLPCTLAEGFQADCYDANGAYLGSASTSKSVEVKANKVLNLGVIDTRIEKMYTDLSAEGTANSYIISEPGNYKIKANVKGNSTEPLDGTPAIAEVLWESFGTDVAPSVGDLISGVSFKDGYIRFTASSLKGNALIAVEDRNEDILWSWHIWLTDQPADQVYNNGAGTMMDRNLGATSATPGDVHALGLLYQWGRKDPFLGGMSISGNARAVSTVSWPSSTPSDAVNGNVAFAISHPMSFITYNRTNFDWLYTGTNTTDDTRWQNANGTKGLYDPCPVGYCVPRNVWTTAFGSSSFWTDDSSWNDVNKGIDFGTSSQRLGDGRIWYPAAGYLFSSAGTLGSVGISGGYWSTTPSRSSACYLYLNDSGSVEPASAYYRAFGLSVRCCKEGSESSSQQDIDLSADGTANSYVVSTAGDYKIKTVKGNSSESVGSVASAEVLWESFGTNVAPSVGDLVSNVSVDGEYITFTASALKGNASIAAKDASGTILWSWHIWMTDQPADQVYNNGAGTMMDRNLGATSATPGDSRSFGLKYQWGRKDPFMAHADTSYTNTAASTIVWPSSVKSTDKIGTILYATRNPTTYISMCDKNYDWKFSYFEDSDRTRWQNTKTKYDPCPNGYRVPDGGNNGVFYKALRGIENSSAYWDDVNKGMDYSDVMTSGPCWYPCSHLSSSRYIAFYKTCTPAKYWYVYGFVFRSNGDNLWSSCPFAASADYVRCQKIL